MEISDSVRLTLRDWYQHEFDAAMMNVCHAVEGAAVRTFDGKGFGKNAIFTNFLRDNYDILGVCVAPGVNFATSRFKMTLPNPKATGGLPDIADIIYGVHRCNHDHGQALPEGCELIANNGNHPCMYLGNGKVRLSRQVILGLLLTVVLAPVNRGLKNPKLDECGILIKTDKHELPLMINDLWGRADFFRGKILPLFPPPVLTLDCSGIED